MVVRGLLLVFCLLCAHVSAQDSQLKPIFNGRNLEGWYGAETMDPRKRADLSLDELEALRAESAAATAEHWTVEDGELVNDGSGPFLTTENGVREC